MPKDAGAATGVEGDSSPPSNVVYTELEYTELNDLDRIARFVMAVAHSGNYAPTDREQLFGGQRTIAVAISRGDLFIAQNNVLTTRVRSGHGRPRFTAMAPGVEDTIRRMVAVELEWEYAISPEELGGPLPDKPFGNIYWVMIGNGPGDTAFHAEMQLVKCFQENGLAFEGNQIGVSKPCCMSCAARLSELGIDYSYFHRQSALPWTDPGVRERWW